MIPLAPLPVFECGRGVFIYKSLMFLGILNNVERLIIVHLRILYFSFIEILELREVFSDNANGLFLMT